MKADTSELEQSYFQPAQKNADRTIGYVFVAITVLFLFSVYLMGMQRVQFVSDKTVGQHARPTTAQVESEIGNSSEPANQTKD